MPSTTRNSSASTIRAPRVRLWSGARPMLRRRARPRSRRRYPAGALLWSLSSWAGPFFLRRDQWPIHAGLDSLLAGPSAPFRVAGPVGCRPRGPPASSVGRAGHTPRLGRLRREWAARASVGQAALLGHHTPRLGCPDRLGQFDNCWSISFMKQTRKINR